MPCTTLGEDSTPKQQAPVYEAIINSKRVVVLTGAGISVSAGLPDFRSKDGLHHVIRSASSSSDVDTDLSWGRPAKRAKTLKGQDLFSAHVFRQADTTSLFYKFISSLHQLCASEDVKATPTHHFISRLAHKGRLIRCYTQNIDCLEDQVGLSQALDLHKSTLANTPTKRFDGHCVQLHGRIDRVKCGCGYTGSWNLQILEDMSDGFAPDCPGCKERADNRKSQRKRSIKQVGHMGALKPAITLYDDGPSPDDITIANISGYDLTRKVDLVLVMGTSLKIPGFKNLVKDFVYQAQQRNGKSKVSAVLINATDVLSSEWKNVFDYFVMDQSDRFIQRLDAHWKKTKPDDWLHQVAFSDLSNATNSSVPLSKSRKRNATFSSQSAVVLLTDFQKDTPSRPASKHPLMKQDSSVVFMGSTIRTAPSSPKAGGHRRYPSQSADVSVEVPKPKWAWSNLYSSKPF